MHERDDIVDVQATDLLQIFLPYLIRSFGDVPGLRHVLAGQYHLMDSATDQRINDTSWSLTVYPRGYVKMAIVDTIFVRQRLKCPRFETLCVGVDRTMTW